MTGISCRLSQKDVALAIRRKWLVLALDGFDELVARIGSRDAFLRVTELLDQLDNQGTVILSARRSFFELYQITSAIRTYLQPRRGSYSTSIVSLQRWGTTQGREVFEKLGSGSAEKDFGDLERAFSGDADVVFHPFFLTRLAQLWVAGERFVAASGWSDRLARSKYVIEKLVEREAVEKWQDRDKNPIISPKVHVELLAGIAEEMWRSGAFALDAEELKLAAQLGLSETLPPLLLGDVLSRLPTHAALSISDRKGVSFLHDSFLHYFLGTRH